VGQPMRCHGAQEEARHSRGSSSSSSCSRHLPGLWLGLWWTLGKFGTPPSRGQWRQSYGARPECRVMILVLRWEGHCPSTHRGFP
jgi:hypothetical protein